MTDSPDVRPVSDPAIPKPAHDASQETWINLDHVAPPPRATSPLPPDPLPRVGLSTFEPWHAFDVARWAKTTKDLWWLAPNTPPPLTVSKVLGWKRDHGAAFILRAKDDETSLGYAELNPMRDDRTHFWLGHVVVRPDRRGAGLGRALLRELLHEAFESRSAERVSLIVFPENTPAISCYQAMGFTIVGEEFHQFRGAGPKYRLHRMQISAWGYFEVHFELLHPSSTGTTG